MTLSAVSWPACRLGEAIDQLARHGGLAPGHGEPAAPPPAAASEGRRLGAWIEAAAARLGLDAEEVESPYADAGPMLTRAAPALLAIPGDGEPRFLALLGGDGRRVAVLAPDLSRQRRPLEQVHAALCGGVEGPAAGRVEQVLDAAGVRGRRRQRVRRAVLRRLLASARVGGCWLLRPAGGTGLAARAREAGLPRLLAGMLAAQVAAFGLFLLSWGLLGRMTLGGRLDPGWLQAWLLLLATLVPFRLLASAAEGLVALRAGAVLKRHLLKGALRLEPDEVRHLGVGALLGQVIESEVVESTALTGGFLAVHAAVELALAGLVLGAGAGGPVHLALLAACAGAVTLAGRGSYRARQIWTDERLAMTGDLVEKMAGHRTRLAQEPRAGWNEGEDQALERYLAHSRRLDALAVRLRVVLPRSWVLAAFLGLAPAVLAGAGPAALALAVGGIILAGQAFRHLGAGLEQLAAAAIAWRRVQPFWRAAERPEPVGHPALAATAGSGGEGPAGGQPLVEARGLVFRYRDRGGPVLHGFDLHIGAGERLLLEGPSGAGKSTLAAVLAGARQPESGLLLLRGLDRDTLGARGWRRRVAVVPQFHENHVLTGTLAYNALLGRGWPPRPGDLEDAERMLRALQLGPLLERMPAGLHQTVGETGWQLSHGERSRLYVARALLQGADLLLFDESFAALDPQTLAVTLTFVLRKAPTLIVIAHP
jgi:ATP-binding cassette subfamily B protein